MARLNRRKSKSTAVAKPDLSAWLGNGRVVVLDSKPADEWLIGKTSFDDYFATAVAKARREARADIDEQLSHA